MKISVKIRQAFRFFQIFSDFLMKDIHLTLTTCLYIKRGQKVHVVFNSYFQEGAKNRNTAKMLMKCEKLAKKFIPNPERIFSEFSQLFYSPHFNT